MRGSWLTSFWIVSPNRCGPLGFGVTAFSVDEAISIIRSEGFGDYLPTNPEELQVQPNVTINQLDQGHVVPNMGPMVMRGLWYPCCNLGFPRRF